MGPPKTLNEIIIFAPTPSFLERGDLSLDKNLAEYKKLRAHNNFWRRNTIFIEIGETRKPSELIRELSDMGYARHMGDLHKGEFFQQGGLITIFPINSEAPVTIEFNGNIIAHIREAKIIPHEKKLPKIAKHDLQPGDYVVHEDHGIGIFRGKVNGYLVLEYAPARIGGDPDKLLVPEAVAKKISPYLGLKNPKINRLGTPLWFETRKKAKEDIIKFANELLELYKKRTKVTRPAYEPSHFEKEIWDKFEFEETPSQKNAIRDIFNDLEKNEPMERLVVGDVGFGKTEVALRTALRAVLNGKQVAILSPTTILADQHSQTFKKRLAEEGIEIARLTRLEAKPKAKEILKKISEGKIDIVIGTHRILSKDIDFKNLGLLVIDEEQRFGVRHKETLKKKYPEVDVLYLSATPIPRTLAFSISKIRPISQITDPPAGRIPISTFILPRTDKIIVEAISQELGRGGQIYFLSPRIHKMPFILKKLEQQFPKVKKEILHGKVGEKHLVETMRDFREGKIKILVSTTIIENGLDISSVNTLIVEDSTKLGLSQSHQLRGRVGRTNIQAYAYFLYPSQKLTPKAEDRLEALLSFQELGAGFEIAKRDLELRGAGNILGREQTGVLNKIGWNLYFQYLGETLDEMMD
ncbi:DEAD/DEAH box helicase [Candidatus Giovannonibacteria bacterium]|nr:DEAD/DEAH box helicase [Candidatus Giovannonibacteria bacterium]